MIRLQRDGPDANADAKNQMDELNIALLRTKAEEHKRRRNNFEAIKVYEQIVEKVPDDLASRTELASLYIEQNQYEKSIEMWDALLKIDPENTKYQDGLVNAYRSGDRIDEAIQLAQGYIQENPQIGLYHSRLAELYASNGQNDVAITTYKKAIELSPSDAKSHEELANIFEEEGDYEAAEKSYNDALKYAAPGSNQTKIRQNLMKIYQRQGKLEEILKQAEEQGTLTFDMQRERARIYQNSGEMDKAASAYQKALGMTSDRYARGDIQKQLITIYSNLGKFEEYLKETEEQGAISFEMQKEIARRYQNKREYEKAAYAYKKALQMTTQSHERHQLDREMMRMLRQSGKIEQFILDMEKDGTITTEMQLELAKYYSSRGKSKKAIETYDKAYDMTTSTGDRERISTQLMNEYVRIGNTETPIELYEKLISNASDSRSITSYSGLSGFSIKSKKDRVRESLINAFKQNRKLNELEAIFKTKLESNAEDPDILLLIAEIYRNSDKYEMAAEGYKTLTKVEPNNILHYYYAAVSLYKTEQKEQANELIKKGNDVLSSSSKNDDVILLCKLASICYESEMYEPAIAQFQNAAKVYEMTGINDRNSWQNENIYQMLGRSYMETKQYEQAVETYQRLKKIASSNYTKENADKAIKRAYDEGNLHEKHIPEQLEKVRQNPNDVNARITLVESYVSSEKYDEAIVQYQKLTELQPDEVKWHKTVAGLYQMSDKIDTSEGYEKSAAAYEKAITLDPNSYELYDLLGKLHVKHKDSTKAVEVYMSALKASLKPNEHDKIVTSILELHNTRSQLEKRIEILEEINSKRHHSQLLHKLLGDTYLASDETEKASNSYREWLNLAKKNSQENNSGMEFHQLAVSLMNKNKLPEIALEAAKQATVIRSDSTYFSTLGNAYLLNEKYEEAFKQFERSFNIMNQSRGFRSNQVEPLLRRISQASKNVKDKTRYLELMGKLIDSIPIDVKSELNTILLLAEFSRELNLTVKAKEFMQKTGFFPETSWLTLGPFDNTKGIGYNTAFISEEQTQIDKTTEYDGVTGKIKWGKGSDETFDGFYDFGKDEQFYAAYAWISFTSPEEREAEIRFDSDDQGKVYLNGTKVYAHRRTRGASVDRRTIPATLVSGKNTILVKVCNESLPWGFYLRITDTDRNPFDDLKIVDTE